MLISSLYVLERLSELSPQEMNPRTLDQPALYSKKPWIPAPSPLPLEEHALHMGSLWSEAKHHSPQRHTIRRRTPTLLAPVQVGWFLPQGNLGEGWSAPGSPMFTHPWAGSWSRTPCRGPAAECQIPPASWEGQRGTGADGSDRHFSSKPSSCSLLCSGLFPALPAQLPLPLGHSGFV